MSLRQRLASAPPSKETVLTVGVFDGIHKGHCHLLRRLVQLAGASYQPAVLTFTNHPVTVLRPGVRVGYLTTPEQKVRLLKEQGIDFVVAVEFSLELSRISAHDFTATLVELLRMRGLVLGPDTALGHNREGDLDYLRRRGAELGFWVEAVEPLAVGGITVKSRRVRDAVSQGDVGAGAKLLGRKFSLSGPVVLGDRRGRKLGFPTANLSIASEMLLPGDGIYATWAIIDGVRHLSATSVGVRPTFGLSERLVEVYVIDFDADLYGKQLCVEFVRKLRDQEAFPGVAELVEQIHRDVADSRQALVEDSRFIGAEDPDQSGP
jgi:riboflavin kinase/FMN adenylyltransferase